MNNNFVNYLNSLHNAGANNENAIAEVSIGSEYFDKMLVHRPVDEFVRNLFVNKEPSFTIITGHAGDGKTSMLIQLLKSCNYSSKNISSMDEIEYEGKKLFFIKDFSEFKEAERDRLFRDCERKISNGNHVVLIANTGPLMNTIANRFNDQITSDFISLIQDGKGTEVIFESIPYHVINIAKLENHDFIKPYLSKLIGEENFDKCQSCEKTQNCPILFNQNLVKDNFDNITNFLEYHLIWQNEHGVRSTVRQIIALLAFSITGGLDCSKINTTQNSDFIFNYMLSNNMFGAKGCVKNRAIYELQAIKELTENGYDGIQLPCDYTFHIERKFDILDPNILTFLTPEYYDEKVQGDRIHDFQKALRRMYILFNHETDSEKMESLTKSLFSNQFPAFLKIKNNTYSPGEKIKGSLHKLVMSGISSLFLEGSRSNTNSIVVTLKRESSIEQVVQIELGSIQQNQLTLEKVTVKQFSENCSQEIYIRSKDKTIEMKITLPLLNYFEQIQSGILSSNIDPHLSHGIDALKAQITTYATMNEEEDEIRFQSLTLNGWESQKLEKINDRWGLE